jgi:hypothetical protein
MHNSNVNNVKLTLPGRTPELSLQALAMLMFLFLVSIRKEKQRMCDGDILNIKVVTTLPCVFLSRI